MKYISFLMSISKKAIAFSILSGMISGATNIWLLSLISAALASAESRAAISLTLFIGVCLFALGARACSEQVLIRLGQKTTFDLRMRLCRRILTVPLRRLEEFGPHRILSALTDDVFTITHLIMFIPNLCISLTVVVGCLIYLAWLSWAMLFVALGFMAFGIVSYQLPLRKAVQVFELVRKGQDVLFKHFRALTDGIKELKLHFGRREAYSRALQSTAASQRRNSVLAMSISMGAASWGQILFFILIGVLVFGLPTITSVDQRLLTGAVLTILFMRGSLETMMNLLPNLGQANVAFRNVEDLGLQLAKFSESVSTSPLKSEPHWKRLELAGVTHAYHGEPEGSSFSIGPIDLTFHSGETVFIVGGNGSGKTTFAKILTGLYNPEKGEILLDGQPITEETRDYYRQRFSVVFSDFFLFESLLGLEVDGSDPRLCDYLIRLQLDHKVRINGDTFSTTNLSQGQRKRLALLIAYLEDRPIYLFDEWAADQDPLFRDVFYHQLLPELKARGKTLFVISHDDRYYHLADRIIKLDYGEVEFDLSSKRQIAEQYSGALARALA